MKLLRSGCLRSVQHAYMRASGSAQLDGNCFPRQLAAIRKHVAGNSMCIAEVFEEKAVPGKTEWDHRHAWTAMLAQAPQTIIDNGVRTILIEKLDRLARDVMVQEHIIANLRKRGVTLISALEPDLCINDPTRKPMRQIMGAVAEYDHAMISLKLEAGKALKRATTGKREGRKLFGDKPGGACTRDRIRAMRRTGSTLQSI